jgi:hypothetical protein
LFLPSRLHIFWQSLYFCFVQILSRTINLALRLNLWSVSVQTIFLLSFITDSHIKPVHPRTPHVSWDHFYFKYWTCAQLIRGKSLLYFTSASFASNASFLYALCPTDCLGEQYAWGTGATTGSMLGLGEFSYFNLPKSFPLLECDAVASSQFNLWTWRNCNERSPQFPAWACFCGPANQVSLLCLDSFSVRADLACLSTYQKSALHKSSESQALFCTGILCSPGLPIWLCLIKGQLCSQTCMKYPQIALKPHNSLLICCHTDTSLNYSSEMTIQYTNPFPAFRRPERVEPTWMSVQFCNGHDFLLNPLFRFDHIYLPNLLSIFTPRCYASTLVPIPLVHFAGCEHPHSFTYVSF